MKATSTQRGPWSHRLLVYAFAVLFGTLIYWLLTFSMRDIGTWPGPAYADVEKRLSDAKLTRESGAIANQIEEVNRAIANRKQRQTILRDSTGNSEKTMARLQSSVNNGKVPTAEEARVLAESQRLFLANQAKYQELNDQITTENEQLVGLQDRQRDVQKKIDAQRPVIQAEYDRLNARHNFKLAAGKLSVLLPLLAVAGFLFLKKRGSLYVTLIYGFGLALLVKVGLVMHEHFPTRYFKYILIVIAIALVTRILIYLLRAMAFPKLDWLLKQYRDAYEHFFCPVCSHPIRRGPRQHLFWNRRSLPRLCVPAATNADEPYTCPACATRLFEECPACKKIRHALLPACTHCGAIKELQPVLEKK